MALSSCGGSMSPRLPSSCPSEGRPLCSFPLVLNSIYPTPALVLAKTCSTVSYSRCLELAGGREMCNTPLLVPLPALSLELASRGFP